MRRLVAIVGIAVLGALFLSVGVAGAQTTKPKASTVSTCSLTVSTTNLPVGGGNVQVSGVAPAGVEVRIFVNGVQAATAHASATGAWGPVTLHITTTSTISASALTDYPPTPCGSAKVNVAQPVVARALPRTGSNHTERYVLIGLAAVLVGGVLVFAARRREHTHGRV